MHLQFLTRSVISPSLTTTFQTLEQQLNSKQCIHHGYNMLTEFNIF